MKRTFLVVSIFGLWMAGAAFAAESNPAPPKVDSGDTAWLLISSALVMLMTPGLALSQHGETGYSF